MVSALNFKPFEKGAMRGFFDLRYHGLVIKGCRLMSGSNGLWIALPQKKAEKDGENQYFDQMYLTQPEGEHVRKLVLVDLQAQGHIAADHQPPSTQQQAIRPRYVSPEGEDLSQYHSSGDNEDITF